MENTLKALNETIWINPSLKKSCSLSHDGRLLTMADVFEAKAFIDKMAPYLSEHFSLADGMLASPLTPISSFQRTLITFIGGRIPGHWYLKGDHALPISGSIKARGGIYTLLRYAEKLAKSHQMTNFFESAAGPASPELTTIYSQHTVVVSSTGNLGLSIGLIGKSIGFNVEVHMSVDAKDWKVERLKALGAQVIQHAGDYSESVKLGRSSASGRPNTYFIDDEDSVDLFLGYSIAGLELQAQLETLERPVDSDHPLFVYLPCGVGGAPSGIAFALKAIFGENVHLFTAEPTHAPCMLLGLSTERWHNISVSELGIDGQTLADGLAVGRSSELASKTLSQVLSGAYTVSDEKLLRMLYLMHEAEGIDLEPSALAGLIGPAKLYYETDGFNYLKTHKLLEVAEQATHVSWATGGIMVPDNVMAQDIKRGQDSSLNTF
ncbi:D-serine ammonia-lyase [Fusibacter paucivorans]|uniref:Probable D-serine dehydratase n=1 Tax=Fusibacter paucivorans TaxID=76009 RepID=A0ABS5PUK5_9FIRM|nr:D-serine ammonia-lyase [Fusibacter paucivorans]MBS7528079.1 D-serine ammonia-lyase [Fusibacter paucivorans]